MKKYVAIGHFKGEKNIITVSMYQNSLKDFRRDMIANEFKVMAAMTENHMLQIIEERKTNYTAYMNSTARLTSNPRTQQELYDYIIECDDEIITCLFNAK